MKILFAGGGTGGHFYPIIAVAEAVYEKSKEKRILSPKLYYMAPTKYNPRALFDNDIEFVSVPAGKLRRYFSILNFFDLFKTFWGVMVAIIKVYKLYPDVVFSKGGYASFPVVFSAKILRIPVVIHESDSSPGRVNKWSAKFAEKIAISYPETSEIFKKITKDEAKIAFTGNPVRKEIMNPLSNGAREFLKLEENTPVIFIIGGSQGSENINNVVMDGLNLLVEKYQIIHQTGRKNFKSIKETSAVIMRNNSFAYRYHPFDYLDTLSIRMSAGVSDVIISRAGSSIFEIASWSVPSIIIPLSTEVSHDQTKNAFAYARSGACSVISEHNLTSSVLVGEINRIVSNQDISDKMRQATDNFKHPDASQKIALAILDIALKHE